MLHHKSMDYVSFSVVPHREELVQEQARELEENVEALTEGFNSLDSKMSNVTSVATKFGDRLQVPTWHPCTKKSEAKKHSSAGNGVASQMIRGVYLL